LSSADAARNYWGLATIYQREKKWEKALNQAINGFILADAPIYTPRSMLIAIRVLIKQNKYSNAATTWNELKKRYPAYAQQHKTDDIILQLQKD